MRDVKAERSSGIAISAGLAMLALSIVACTAPAALGQGGAQPVPVESASKASHHEMVIVSDMPMRKAKIRALLKRMQCKSKGDITGAASAELWSVPRTQMSRVSKQLQAAGAKVIKLRDDWNHIMSRHQGRPTAAQKKKMDKIKATPGAVGVQMLRAPDAALSAFAMTNETYRLPTPGAIQGPAEDHPPSTLVLPISPTQNITLLRKRYTTDQRGCVWSGIVAETGDSALLMRWKDGRMSGLVGYKGRIYTVQNLGGRLHAMIEMDPRRLPPDHISITPTADPRADLRPDIPTRAAAISPSSVVPLSDSERKRLEAKRVVIDLMILHTKKAASHYLRDPADMSVMAVEQANDALRNSGLGNISLRLVHTQAVDYDESTGEHFDHLYRMVDGRPPFNDIKKLRNDKKADIVGLVVDDASGCGLSTRVAPDAEDAFFVVHHSCASITISIAHEIGHILGARHDRAIDNSTFPFPYGHGYVNGKWRDIMSYQRSCHGCVRIPYWSNPRITYRGEPTGTKVDDNARVILEQAERVSNFR